MGFLAALIHELGHVIAFVLVLDFPSEISFEISGIKMVRSKKITSYKKEVFQLLMGSFFNFILFFILFFSLNSINRISIFAVNHLILGIFNLLPIQALDGGKLLRLFWEKKTDIQTAYRITNIISWSTLLGLTVVSVIFFLHQKSGNLSFTDLYLDVQYKLKENGVKRIGFTLFSYFFFTLDKGDFLIASSICSFEMWV